MISLFLATTLAPIALQTAAQSDTPPIRTFDDLPIEQSTPPRCGVAFAIVGGWQAAGDPRGANYPDMQSEGGREFFVRSLANLMDASSLSRENVEALVRHEAGQLATQEGLSRVEAMMPACLLMKRSQGL